MPPVRIAVLRAVGIPLYLLTGSLLELAFMPSTWRASDPSNTKQLVHIKNAPRVKKNSGWREINNDKDGMPAARLDHNEDRLQDDFVQLSCDFVSPVSTIGCDFTAPGVVSGVHSGKELARGNAGGKNILSSTTAQQQTCRDVSPLVTESMFMWSYCTCAASEFFDGYTEEFPQIPEDVQSSRIRVENEVCLVRDAHALVTWESEDSCRGKYDERMSPRAGERGDEPVRDNSRALVAVVQPTKTNVSAAALIWRSISKWTTTLQTWFAGDDTSTTGQQNFSSPSDKNRKEHHERVDETIGGSYGSHMPHVLLLVGASALPAIIVFIVVFSKEPDAVRREREAFEEELVRSSFEIAAGGTGSWSGSDSGDNQAEEIERVQDEQNDDAFAASVSTNASVQAEATGTEPTPRSAWETFKLCMNVVVFLRWLVDVANFIVPIFGRIPEYHIDIISPLLRVLRSGYIVLTNGIVIAVTSEINWDVFVRFIVVAGFVMQCLETYETQRCKKRSAASDETGDCDGDSKTSELERRMAAVDATIRELLHEQQEFRASILQEQQEFRASMSECTLNIYGSNTILRQQSSQTFRSDSSLSSRGSSVSGEVGHGRPEPTLSSPSRS